MNYRLSEAAKADIRRNYIYGLRKFGEIQADKYYLSLFQRFEDIAANPYLYPVDYQIDGKIRKSVFGSDTIYYDVDHNLVSIVRVLGQQDREALLKK